MRIPPIERIHELDGIRGYASLVVLLYHAFPEMLGRLMPILGSSWFAPIFEGRLAVCVFFVLSGDALTTAFFSRGPKDPVPLDRLVIRRYARLTIPIVMSCALVYAVRLAHLDFHHEASILIQRPDWLGKLIEFQFSVIGFLRYALLGVYNGHTKETSFNPFLWTMSLEMQGSMLLFFLTCCIWPRLRKPKTALMWIAGFLFLLNSFLSLFFIGTLLGLLRQESFYSSRLAGGRAQLGCVLVLVGILAILIIRHGYAIPLFEDMAIAAAIVFCLYSNSSLRRFLGNRFSTWLGDISFPLYLVQFAVLISVESGLLILWRDQAWPLECLPLIGVATVGITMVAAWIFRKAERRSLKAADDRLLRLLA